MTCLIPICDNDSIYIMHCEAKNFNDAQDKFILDLKESYDIEEEYDWSDFIEFIYEKYGIIVGDIYDKEEF